MLVADAAAQQSTMCMQQSLRLMAEPPACDALPMPVHVVLPAVPACSEGIARQRVRGRSFPVCSVSADDAPVRLFLPAVPVRSERVARRRGKVAVARPLPVLPVVLLL